MKTFACAGAIAAFSLLFAVHATAQSPAFKCPAAGTVVEFSDGSRATWTGQEERSCRMTQKDPQGTEAVLFWYAPAAIAWPATQAWADQMKPWALWPLAVGKSVHGRYDGPWTTASSTPGLSRSLQNIVVVERIERVTTKSGTFDTFVVSLNQEGRYQRFWSTFRQWYAPEPGVTVKYEYNDTTGVKSSGEAVSIRR